MDGLKRYSGNLMYGQPMIDDAGAFTLFADAQSELAALREELAECRRDRDTEQRAAIEANKELKATEQRNARYESLLRQIIPCLAMSTNSTAQTYIRQITEALPQPTESGASDKCVSDGGTCGLGGQCAECPHKESGASE